MATNIIMDGDRVPFVCTAAVTSGDLIVAGSMFGIALMDGAIGDTITLDASGQVVSLPKHAADTFAVGAKVYWDNTNKYTTSTTTSNTYIGVAVLAAAGGDANTTVRLNESF